jgi:phosphotransferase system HPr (HPr) family protein
LTANQQVDMARILVVDDHPDTAETAAKWLELVGHDVRIAYDGYHALDLARRQQPNYVLLDLGLPRLDGYQVASRLRRELDGPLVIIAITGYGLAEDRRRALEAGCDYVFLKPVDPDALMPLLSQAGTGSGASIDPGPPVQPGHPAKDPTRTSRRQVEIVNALGLHLRAAGKFVELAGQFQANVRITHDGHMASGASVLDLTSLAAPCGSSLELEADGPEAEAALDALTELIVRRFDEQA